MCRNAYSEMLRFRFEGFKVFIVVLDLFGDCQLMSSSFLLSCCLLGFLLLLTSYLIVSIFCYVVLLAFFLLFPLSPQSSDIYFHFHFFFFFNKLHNIFGASAAGLLLLLPRNLKIGHQVLQSTDYMALTH